MRTLIIAAGLCLATSPALAGAENDIVARASTDANIALANGCVYAPSRVGGADTWSLVYAKSGAAGRCAMTVRTRSGQGTQPTYGAKGQTELASDFVVGVFR